ncbi:protein-L-isoaspartate O-methyltransferase [Phyllobacterium brassicacearum]|uniref:Protein-L-isoaspartate O-methyltransferase n=1 Tax=Phyllobacterium brassicacearum TaxID=314235 RepID=A0A2P7BMK2_9HYPH|nr:methyltransferase domain-containing protein [Phyllobacterium brassicacearum]PSH67699.1 protein-L-isoaspartate O-methyltransferase [Phyllobacterium brassicacearum]TDQ25939.1 protein-L-isoaspartate(D-aspartate) O-methyltransferase [Phyllobacterium brassicacearum]
MTDAGKLETVRRAYAKQILASVGVEDARIEQAFADVPREDFLGRGPWPISRFGLGYVYSPNDDPTYLYTDDLVGIAPERHINNGEPSLHAHLLWFAQLAKGEHVVHVGTGTGYYTAIMAHLVGSSGHVTGIELEPDLAARARDYLSPYSNVEIVEGDGTVVPFEPADVIYVNAGATRPADIWLDRLKDGGRLVLPLTTDDGFTMLGRGSRPRGAVFLITREGSEFSARSVSGVAIYPCAGVRDAKSERALAIAFADGSLRRVSRFYRTSDIPDDRCWLKGDGWCLAYD